ncbi:hypothetical protein [Pseudomonas mangiferae]|uniref:Uncharacterized protein n=1 Tax=Pseudomonas mangiferae TaxID=2593654 RepID=A0A553GZ64_9PSED|nr:hypothetical protein [Pseudomonas mangiferae]TRX74774.1 hypothetical protein FM069_09550 [Pseudomonas mangiferae]
MMQLNEDSVEEWLKELLSKDFLSGYDDEEKVIDCLDSRDTDPFDSEWVSVDKLLSNEIKNSSEKDKIESLRDRYRKSFFDKVIRSSGSADLASYVSEDIELIIGVIFLSIESDFIYSMICSYAKDVVPDNDMERLKGMPEA